MSKKYSDIVRLKRINNSIVESRKNNHTSLLYHLNEKSLVYLLKDLDSIEFLRMMCIDTRLNKFILKTRRLWELRTYVNNQDYSLDTLIRMERYDCFRCREYIWNKEISRRIHIQPVDRYVWDHNEYFRRNFSTRYNDPYQREYNSIVSDKMIKDKLTTKGSNRGKQLFNKKERSITKNFIGTKA